MQRVFTGLLLGAAWVALLLLGPFALFWPLLCGVGVLALREYRDMAFGGAASGVGVSWLAGLLPMLAAATGRPDAVTAGLAAGLILLAAHAMVRYGELDNGLGFLSRSAFGLLYLGIGLSHLILLRALENGVFWLLLLTVITAASDTGAYYSGSRWGRTKLCVSVSPGKTWEGAVGGLVLAVAAAVVLGRWLAPGIAPWSLALLATVLSVVGVLGDLLESVIKRSTGVKDSGALLAGHGGVLDRGDSLLLAAPFLYYLLSFGVVPG